jgi:hypothetical protein
VAKKNTPRSNPASTRARVRTSQSAVPSAPIDAAADMSTHVAGVNTGPATPDGPTYDEIADAAYHRYLRRGGQNGADVDDWVEAERELRARRSH